MGQGADTVPLFCKKCEDITYHLCEKDLGNFYCINCGERMGARAPIIQRHKEFFEPEGRVKVRTKSKIVVVK